MRFNAKITDRTLKFINPEYLKNFLREMSEGQFLIIDIEKRKNIRSLSQNSLYWGYILPTIADYTGYTSEELHSVFKRQFLPRKYITLANKRKLVDPTTTKLTTKDFTEYIEKIMVWSAQELSMEW